MSRLAVAVAGASGRLGRLAAAAVREADDLDLVAELRRGDDWRAALDAAGARVVVDVSLAEATRAHLPGVVAAGVAPVVGTSGLVADDLARLAEACARGGVGGLVVPNFSLGAVLQMHLAGRVAAHMACAGLREVHHAGKRDSPSGTARATADLIGRVRGEAPAIHSERRPDALAEQEVHFTGADGHESLTLGHVVRDRAAYLPGLLLAVRRVRDLQGLHTGLESLLLG